MSANVGCVHRGPVPHDLQSVIGEIRRPLGEVRVRRPVLPDLGTLYATRNGLFFAPHETNYLERSVPIDETADSLLWTVGSVVWAPLAILLPIMRLRSRSTRTVRTPILQPRYIDAHHADASLELPKLLTNHPGRFLSENRAAATRLVGAGTPARQCKSARSTTPPVSIAKCVTSSITTAGGSEVGEEPRAPRANWHSPRGPRVLTQSTKR